MTYGVEKLEWRGYPMMKNFEDMFIHFGRIHGRDGQADTARHRPRLHSIMRQKWYIKRCHLAQRNIFSVV